MYTSDVFRLIFTFVQEIQHIRSFKPVCANHIQDRKSRCGELWLPAACIGHRSTDICWP